jgi:menaquinone-specific isochorismate synthase
MKFLWSSSRRSFSAIPFAPYCFPPLLSRTDLPSVEDWPRHVEQALTSIRAGEEIKYVLARKTTFTFSSPLSPLSLYASLQAPYRIALISPHSAFLSASPEKLYCREGGILQTEALAGTRLTDRPFTAKERKEHTIVLDAIIDRLRPFSIHIAIHPTEEYQAGAVTHLRTPITAYLHTVDDQALIQALHPTPAIASFPGRKIAFEPFERGFYSSPIGYIDLQGAEIAVAIRAATIEKNQLIAYAGVGIVEGSDPEKEWEELEGKIALWNPVKNGPISSSTSSSARESPTSASPLDPVQLP